MQVHFGFYLRIEDKYAILFVIIISNSSSGENLKLMEQIKSGRKYQEFSDFIAQKKENIISIVIYNPGTSNEKLRIFYTYGDYFKYNYAEQKWENNFDLNSYLFHRKREDSTLYGSGVGMEEFFTIQGEERNWTQQEQYEIHHLVRLKLRECGLDYKYEIEHKRYETPEMEIYEIRHTLPKEALVSKNPY